MDIRALRWDDDLDAQLDLGRRAFGPADAAAQARYLAELEAGIGGGQYHAAIPARSLAALPPAAAPEPAPPALRRAGPGDAEQVIAVLGAVYASARHCGPVTRDTASVQRWLSDESLFCYLAEDGFLAYRWAGTNRDILVRAALAGSAAATRALWSVVGSHASIAERVLAVLPPDDPVAWLPREPDAEQTEREPWMLRVVDAPAAVSGRGYPAVADLSVTLELEDAQLAGNAGRWTLHVAGGRGSLRRHGTEAGAAAGPGAPVSLGSRGFAALYAGVPMPTLRAAGLAAGGDAAADEALDCAFGASAFMLDEF